MDNIGISEAWGKLRLGLTDEQASLFLKFLKKHKNFDESPEDLLISNLYNSLVEWIEPKNKELKFSEAMKLLEEGTPVKHRGYKYITVADVLHSDLHVSSSGWQKW